MPQPPSISTYGINLKIVGHFSEKLTSIQTHLRSLVGGPINLKILYHPILELSHSQTTISHQPFITAQLNPLLTTPPLTYLPAQWDF